MVIRSAAQAEQDTIKRMVRAAKLNPINLHWQNFKVAEDDGVIIGVGQLRPHTDGSRELASLVVLPAYRRHGIGSQLMAALMTARLPPIYLFCEHELETYYIRFGYQMIENPETLPPSLARLFRVGSIVKRIDNLFGKTKTHLIGMRWDGKTKYDLTRE
ncbi:MAG TPA: GNAT family N-acetyltransferase [Anaerolineae bacterium]|jgi:amino-acid N-acetyltransferase